MAGDWIKMRGNLWDDPRVARLVEETDQSEAAVIGGLYWLWATADQHSSDGLLHGMTTRTVDRKTGVPGLGAALVSIGWLIENAEGVTVSRFDEHNGASAKARAQTARRVASHKGNAKVTQSALPEAASAVTSALPREREEKEEEKNNDNTVVVDPSEPGNPRAAALPPREEPPESTDPAIVLAVALRKLGVDAMFTHPAVQGWSKRQIPMDMLNAAVALAREQKGPTAKIAPNYLVPIVDKLLNPPAPLQPAFGKPVVPIQIRKPQGMDPKGTDESYEEYEARIQAAERDRRQGSGI